MLFNELTARAARAAWWYLEEQWHPDFQRVFGRVISGAVMALSFPFNGKLPSESAGRWDLNPENFGKAENDERRWHHGPRNGSAYTVPKNLDTTLTRQQRSLLAYTEPPSQTLQHPF